MNGSMAFEVLMSREPTATDTALERLESWRWHRWLCTRAGDRHCNVDLEMEKEWDGNLGINPPYLIALSSRGSGGLSNLLYLRLDWTLSKS